MAAEAGPKGTKILRVRDTTLRANCLFYNAHKPNDILSIRRLLTKGEGEQALGSWERWRCSMCDIEQKRSSAKHIVMRVVAGVENMTRAGPKCNPGGFWQGCAGRAGAIATVTLFLFLSPTLAWTQRTVPDNKSGGVPEQQDQQSGSAGDSGTPVAAATEPPPQSAAASPVPDVAGVEPKASSEGQQTKRMFWIIPNFAAVSADTQLPPLTTREKYGLAMQDSVDYSSFVWAGMLAGQSMALRSYPELHNGMAGYGRYYWRAFADQASGSFFTEALVPAVLHEDPRYYTLGHGGFFHRVKYALSRVVVTKMDSGGTGFNYAEIVGNGMEAGLSNLYYPPQERSLHNTAMNYVAQLEAASLNNIIREFWPDIRRKMLRQK
jgi:hypothetical protein